jgi:hypothetical protein
MGKRLMAGAWTLGLLLLVTSAAFAQEPAPVRYGYHPTNLGEAVLSTLIFSAIGIAAAIIGFRIFDILIPFDLDREICENNNIAAGVLGGAMVLGICIIVACVVLS